MKDMITVLRQIDRDFFKCYDIKKWKMAKCHLAAVNPLAAFYDIQGRKGQVLFFCSVSDTTRDLYKQVF
jgi:hypothetical protein